MESNIQLVEAAEKIVRCELSKIKDDWNNQVKEKILCRFPLKWVNTVFYTHRKELRKRSNASLDVSLISRAPNNICLRMPALCASAGNNTIELIDPCGKMLVEAQDGKILEMVKEYVGKIVIVKFTKQYSSKTNTYLYGAVKSHNLTFKPTTLDLHGDSNKKDKKGANMEEYAYQYKDVADEVNAIEAITSIQNYGRLNGAHIDRINPTTIICNKNQLYTYNFFANRLELIVFNNENSYNQ